jgi:PucR C-terminal helix-turn-helix domain
MTIVDEIPALYEAGPPVRILPADMAEALYPQLPGIAAEMAEQITVRVADYSRDRDTPYVTTVRMGSAKVLTDFVDRVSGRGRDGTVVELFRHIGKVEARCDRSLDALQSAMHTGCEVMWQRLSASCLDLGIDTEGLRLLADALLVHFRENALAAADGHAEARTQLTTEVQRHRRHLLELLLSDPPVSPAAAAKVAAAAKWKLPETVSVVVLSDRDADDFPSLELSPDILVDLSRSQPCLLVPEPGRLGRAKMLEIALRGCTGVIGPPLRLADAAKSLRWAREAMSLTERGLIAGGGVIRCVDHMSTLMIFQNEDLIDTLAELRLAPLARLRPGQRDRLAETLLAWLRTGGDAGEVAAQLHVHPQTVRYRIRQLREIFGDVLADPDVQLELILALRSRQLLDRARGDRRRRPPGRAPLTV